MQRFDQTIQHATNLGDAVQHWIDIVSRHEADPLRNFELDLEFALRSEPRKLRACAALASPVTTDYPLPTTSQRGQQL